MASTAALQADMHTLKATARESQLIPFCCLPAALFEAALVVELSGLDDFSPESGCSDPLAALLAGTDSMMLPDAWL